MRFCICITKSNAFDCFRNCYRICKSYLILRKQCVFVFLPLNQTCFVVLAESKSQWIISENSDESGRYSSDTDQNLIFLACNSDYLKLKGGVLIYFRVPLFPGVWFVCYSLKTTPQQLSLSDTEQISGFCW